MKSSLTVYKASAGSGKTFTLAIQYIKTLIEQESRHAYSHILAVTFTNKATAEMKDRILQQLYGIWKGLPSSANYLESLQKELRADGIELPEEEIRSRAGSALCHILHDYNRFRVETIDSFFQSVLKNLAHELSLTANLKVDLNDKETWRIEPKQVERAVKDGRHDAKNPIFNWRKVVAQESVRHERWNANRNVLAWKFLTGVEYNDPEKFPYSAVIDRKLGVKDAMALLRLHEDYIGQDQELYHSKSEGICRTTSHDSIVYNLTADPTLTEAWKTLGRPCQSVFVPLYPLAGPAKGTAFTDPATATKEHFAGTPAMFDYRADFTPHSVFSASNNAIDYLRGDELAKRTQLIQAEEDKFMKDRAAVTKKAAGLKGEERMKFLHDYNQKSYDHVLKIMQAENARLMPNKVKILADVVKADGDGTVDFALLGAKGHEVLSANMEATRAGMSANQLNSTRQWKNFAPAEKMVYKDVNNDGITDVVFTFKAKDVTKGAVAGAAMDLWLYTQINGHRVTGFDVVPVENDKVKMNKGARDGKGLL